MPDCTCKFETAYIALGSNLEPREETLCGAIDAINAISGVAVRRVSGLRETVAEGPVADQPPFLNAVAEVHTVLEPAVLLDELLRIETVFGRDRTREVRWGPRILDLDLLLMGGRVVNEPGLELPHPRLHERGFVLNPLVEIAPAAVHPVFGLTAEELKDRFESLSSGMETP